MSTLEVLKRRRTQIFHDQVKDLIINGLLALSGLFAAGAVIAAIAFYLDSGITFNFFLVFPVFVVSAFSYKKLSVFQKYYAPKNHSLIFKQFYSYCVKLNQLDLKDPKSIKSVVTATESLAYTVDNWISYVVPSAIKIIPQSLKSVLENDVTYLLNSKDKEKIHQLQNYFLQLCNLQSTRELTHEEWIKTIKNIISISTGRNIESIQLEEIVNDEQFPIFIQSKKSFPLRMLENPKIQGSIILPVLFVILVIEGNGIGMSLVWGGMGSAGILATFEFIKRHTKPNLKSQSNNA